MLSPFKTFLYDILVNGLDRSRKGLGAWPKISQAKYHSRDYGAAGVHSVEPARSGG